MRIGVDASCWANGRGYGRYTRHLLPEMARMAPEHEFVCFLDARAREQFDLVRNNVRPVLVSQSQSPTEAAAADGNRSPADMLRFTRAVWRERPDVFFSPSVYTYFPLPPMLRSVVTVHDAIAERFPEMTLPSKRARMMWRLKVGLAVWQARLVLTVSDFSSRDLTRYLGIPPRRIRVATEAPAPAFHPEPDPARLAELTGKLGLPPGARWFIYVGGFNPHKYVDVIVRAHARAIRGVENPPYVLLVGTIDADVFHGSQAVIRRAITDAGTEHLVKWTGFVPDEDLRHLYAAALALVLPSACEGFGLPAVEAAACGAPVIATTESPLPELLEGGGIFIGPGDEDALVRAMVTLLGDETRRRSMAARALERAGQLAWPRTARAALDAIQEAAA
ncbi:MAG TPA: glycosyltransferase family 1 protein [Gemmatimonadales bacterium]|jgi:glycosyltransferase involved in cell wall biosynthesis|nr:glycosyltransferase family 1 protein [Gemmatimonadales bacterium]